MTVRLYRSLVSKLRLKGDVKGLGMELVGRRKELTDEEKEMTRGVYQFNGQG